MYWQERTDGYIYLIQADNDLYKIGRTQNPELRAQQIATSYKDIPGGKVMIHHFMTLYADLWERFFHDFYKSLKYPVRYKEWFYLSEYDVALFKCFNDTIRFPPYDPAFTAFVPYEGFEWFYEARFIFFSERERDMQRFSKRFKVILGECPFPEYYRQYRSYDVDVRLAHPIGII